MDTLDDFTGLGVALATPFDRNSEVDYSAFERLIAFVLGKPYEKRPEAASPETAKSPLSPESFWATESGGADFLVVLGSTGEGPTVDSDERRELTTRAVKVSTVPVIIGTGSNSTKIAVRLTREAFLLGADAVLSVVPYYNKPTAEGLYAHFSEVANAAGDKPVIVYNVPGRTGLNLVPSVLSRLWTIPNIVAVKESSGNLAQIGEIVRTLPKGKVLLSGDDALALPAISLGAEGLISVAGNLLPRRMKALVESACSGNRAKAIRLQKELLPIMDSLFVESNPIPLKAALESVGICGGAVRLPLIGATRETRAKLAEVLSKVLSVASFTAS
jgi:4-hydroxy-tetrahydrodipicolinate synthase